MPMDVVFDATQFAPKQSGGAHPVGNKFPFRITGTTVKDTKDNQGKYFEVEFTSPAGSIKNNYNLWNSSKAAQDISLGQLSALCHAVGIFKVDMKNDGAALRGAEGLMDVGFQKGQEPSAEKPEGGYVEIKKVYDKAGNEPGNHSQQQQQSQFNQQQNQSSQQHQVQSGWGGQLNSQQPQQQQAQQAQQNQQQQSSSGWSGGGNAGASANGWSQGNAGEKPPWN